MNSRQGEAHMSLLDAMARAFTVKCELIPWTNAPDENPFTVEEVVNGMRAALAEARKQGFVLVPVEATTNMMIAGSASITRYVKDDETDAGDVYRAMISASPSIDEV